MLKAVMVEKEPRGLIVADKQHKLQREALVLFGEIEGVEFEPVDTIPEGEIDDLRGVILVGAEAARQWVKEDLERWSGLQVVALLPMADTRGLPEWFEERVWVVDSSSNILEAVLLIRDGSPSPNDDLAQVA